ncbi:MAG: hypothetical protein J6T77_05735, partial [Clostridia bacterium]|nr:hypothetical protein [Clostridia bacterium]
FRPFPKTCFARFGVPLGPHSPKLASLVSGSPWGAGTDDIRFGYDIRIVCGASDGLYYPCSI